MAKIVGIESEYGVQRRGRRYPFAAAVIDDDPPRRGEVVHDLFDAVVERHGLEPAGDWRTHWLRDGGVVYIDGHNQHVLLELATPECASALECLQYVRAHDEYVVEGARAIDRGFDPDEGDGLVRVYRRSADWMGNTTGAHENYAMRYSDRSAPAPIWQPAVHGFLATRSLYSGSGSMPPSASERGDGFRLTARGDRVVRRRDNPDGVMVRHGERLEVRMGDHNRADVAHLLKLGTTQLVLALAEDGWLDDPDAVPNLAGGFSSTFDRVDLDGVHAVLALRGGGQVSAIEYQYAFYELAQRWLSENDAALIGGETIAQLITTWWSRVLADLDRDPERLIGVLDWPTKRALMERAVERKGHSLVSPESWKVDLKYHDIRPEGSLYTRLVQHGTMTTVLDARQWRAVVDTAPTRTRAWARAALFQRPEWTGAYGRGDWDVVHAVAPKDGGGQIYRVHLGPPDSCGRVAVEPLLAAGASVVDLGRAISLEAERGQLIRRLEQPGMTHQRLDALRFALTVVARVPAILDERVHTQFDRTVSGLAHALVEGLDDLDEVAVLLCERAQTFGEFAALMRQARETHVGYDDRAVARVGTQLRSRAVAVAATAVSAHGNFTRWCRAFEALIPTDDRTHVQWLFDLRSARDRVSVDVRVGGAELSDAIAHQFARLNDYPNGFERVAPVSVPDVVARVFSFEARRELIDSEREYVHAARVGDAGTPERVAAARRMARCCAALASATTDAAHRDALATAAMQWSARAQTTTTTRALGH